MNLMIFNLDFGWWFTLTLFRSSMKVEVTGQILRPQKENKNSETAEIADRVRKTNANWKL